MCDHCYQPNAALICDCGLVLCYGCARKHRHADDAPPAPPESERIPAQAGKEAR